MRTIYRTGTLTAVPMALVLGGCSDFDRGEEEVASAAGRGAGARLELDAGQGPNAVIKEGGQGKEGLEKKPGKIYSMQIGHSQPVGNPRHQSLLLLKKLLEKKTDGGIQVDIYPAGQLGSEAPMLEQVCDGTIQGFRGGQLEIVPRVLMFSLPFLCEGRIQVERLVNSEFAGEINMDSLKSGVTILGTGNAGGFRQFSNNVRTIRKPEDLRGPKMRSSGMDTINKTSEALGAEVMIAPYNDLYMAPKSGATDGQENLWVNSSGMWFYEVQKYFTEVNYQFHPEPFYVNTRWYKSLPPECQEILAGCTEEMMKENNRLVDENEVQAMEDIWANVEIYTPSREERQAFVEAVQMVYEEYMDNDLLTMDDLACMRRTIRGEEKQECPYR